MQCQNEVLINALKYLELFRGFPPIFTEAYLKTCPLVATAELKYFIVAYLHAN